MQDEARDELLLRLRSIEGHIRAVQRMLEADCPCVDVVRQTLAVKRAVERVSQLLVANHLCTCLAAHSEQDPDGSRTRALHELLDLLELSGRF